MAQLIDTNVFIGMERRGWPARSVPTAGPREPSALASITASELLVGVHRAVTPSQTTRRQAFAEAVFEAFTVLPFDLDAARVHARIGAELTSAGQIIGAHDLIIAATALAHGYAVLTDNIREFARVPGLVIRQPVWE